MNPTLAYKIKMLPESPGCYIMKSRGEIIYVGKAVNLKNRVRPVFPRLAYAEGGRHGQPRG